MLKYISASERLVLNEKGVLINVKKVPDNINQWTFANSKESGEKRNLTRKICNWNKDTIIDHF